MRLFFKVIFTVCYLFCASSASAQLPNDTLVTISQPISHANLCSGDTIQIRYIVTRKFSSWNVFTAQLSDATGSFASTTNIGSTASDTSGVIICTIPAVATGTDYRIRIVAASPVRISPDNGVNLSIDHKLIPLLTTNSPVCEGDTLRLFASSVPAGGYYTIVEPSGLRNNGIISLFINGATLANMGLYKLVASNAGCTDSAIITATVKAKPSKPEVISNSPLCTGFSLKMNIVSATISAVYTWTGPNGFSYTGRNPVINTTSLNNAGTYSVAMQFNGCLSDKTHHQVTILDKPEKPQAGSNSPICEGDAMSLYTQDVAGAYFLWEGPNNFLTNIQNPTLPAASTLATGYYIVKDSISGCTNSDTIYVEVNAYPAKTTITHNAPVCEGDSLLMQIGNYKAGIKYLWGGANGFTDTARNVNIYPATIAMGGNYSIVADNKGCITYGDTTSIRIKPLPEKPIATNNGPLWEGQELVLTGNHPDPLVKYIWTGPDGFKDTAQRATVSNVTKAKMGTYFLITEKEGCLSSAVTIVAVNDFASIDNIVLYPNPGNGLFYVDGKLERDQNIDVIVLNNMGQQVYRTVVASDKKFIKHSFDLRDKLPGGKYVLLINADGKVLRMPFTIARQ